MEVHRRILLYLILSWNEVWDEEMQAFLSLRSLSGHLDFVRTKRGDIPPSVFKKITKMASCSDSVLALWLALADGTVPNITQRFEKYFHIRTCSLLILSRTLQWPSWEQTHASLLHAEKHVAGCHSSWHRTKHQAGMCASETIQPQPSQSRPGSVPSLPTVK